VKYSSVVSIFKIQNKDGNKMPMAKWAEKVLLFTTDEKVT